MHPMENCYGGFEAATIGGFADWFSALFHEIQFLSASIQTL
jgi:uncharacterized membrane-anchored protein YjiN (DUF445 family)